MCVWSNDGIFCGWVQIQRTDRGKKKTPKEVTTYVENKSAFIQKCSKPTLLIVVMCEQHHQVSKYVCVWSNDGIVPKTKKTD